MSFRINPLMHIKLFMLSLTGTLVFNKFFIAIIEDFILRMNVLIGESLILNFYVYMLILITGVSFIHELIHGLIYIIYGGKVRFGYKIIYAYAREISLLKLTRTKFLTVLLGPLVIISLLSLACGAFSGMVFIMNLLGSSGDIYMALSLIRVQAEKRIVDRDYGYEII